MQRDDLRDRTERGLTCCDGAAIYLGHCSEDCPYLADCERADQCVGKLHADALALLKAQEARLLTKEEIISWEGYIWKEFKGMTAMKALLIDHGMEREPYMGDFPTNSYLWDNYNQYWRCWSTQPTKEQRKAVKWDG